MNFEEKLALYAKLIVHWGMNVQIGQDVYIGAEVIHRDFVHKIVEEAYEAGARFVNIELIDPRNNRTRILKTQNKDDLAYVPAFIPFRYNNMIPEGAASLRILGSEYPDILSDLDPNSVQKVEVNFKKSLKKFYEEAIGHSKVHWTLAAAATPAWSKKVFPNLEENSAKEALWNEIFRICRVDKENCLELWKIHNTLLSTRAQKLTDLQIKHLYFTGPSTHLKIGISPLARFKGGVSKSPSGQAFSPNLPTEECFTTPNYHLTEGYVRTTRPFLINGKMIRGLNLTFEKGEITQFSADEGEETFSAYIASDSGSRRLGEVALVGIDSPIYQSGLIFEEILYDENAACHIAIGFAYRFCIKGSENMSPEELASAGCNTSNVHTDMMISSEEVDVFAELYNGEKISLIEKGSWRDF